MARSGRVSKPADVRVAHAEDEQIGLHAADFGFQPSGGICPGVSKASALWNASRNSS
jgi:hypothetical protein